MKAAKAATTAASTFFMAARITNTLSVHIKVTQEEVQGAIT